MYFSFGLMRLLLRKPQYLVLIAGLVAFGIGLNGIIEAASNPSAKTITISEFESIRPSSGWYHITGGQIDLPQATVYNSDGTKSEPGSSGSTVVAPLLGPNDTNGSMPRVYVKSSNPTLVAQAGQSGAFPALDVSGMIEDRSNESSSDDVSPSVGDLGDAVILDDGRQPGSIWKSIGLLVAGIFMIGLGGAMVFGLQIPILNGPEYQWSPDSYKEKPSVRSPQPVSGAAYTGQPGLAQQRAPLTPPGYPQQAFQNSQNVPPGHPTAQPQPAPEPETAPKMKTIDVPPPFDPFGE